jgi:hypothetical protein
MFTILYRGGAKAQRSITLAVFLVFLGISVLAQDTKPAPAFQFFNKTEFGIGIGLGKFKTDVIRGFQKTLKNDEIILPIQTIVGVCISGRAGLGVGAGAEFWQQARFYPVFFHFYYDFMPRDNTPFAYINLGQAFGKRDSTTNFDSGKGGFLLNIGVGYKMRIGKRFQFEYELFYRYQAIQSRFRNYYDTVPTHFQTTDYKVPYNFAGFRIGLLFR